MSHEELTARPPQTPREFYDEVMEASEQNAPFTALSYSKDAGKAYNFLIGYTETLAEADEGDEKRDPYALAADNIRFAAGHCISGAPKDGLTPVQQLDEILGVWPKVFDAAQIIREAQEALESIDQKS